MKKHQLLSFLKGATYAALSCVCLFLTSCGGGGGSSEEPTPERMAAKHFEGRTLTLQSSVAPACTIEMGTRITGTSLVNAFIQYGSGSREEGIVTITSATFEEGKLTKVDVQVSTFTGNCTTERDFKLWWGESDGDTNLAISGDAPIAIEFNSFTNTVETGTYTIGLTVGTGDEATERTLGGPAILER